MSEQVTKKDFQELTGTLLEAINSMYSSLSNMIDEKTEQTENRIKAYIENGVEKRVTLMGESLDALTEKVGALTEKVDAMEEHLGKLTQDTEQLKLDVRSIRATLEEHDNEIFMLRQAK